MYSETGVIADFGGEDAGDIGVGVEERVWEWLCGGDCSKVRALFDNSFCVSGVFVASGKLDW